MFDTAGSRLSFTVTGGIAETFRVSFWVGTREHDVTGATFSAALFDAHGAEHRQVAVIPVQHDERANAVLLSVPPLGAGHYLWELRATDPAGEEVRLLYGVLTALSADDVLDKIQAADESELRELAVQQAGGSADALVLRWQACSTAALQAAEAARSAEAAARAAERAEAAALQAAEAEENVLGKLGAAQAFMESFNKALFEAIRVVDNYLWVGGVNTGHYLRGQDGITPHIGADGYWYVQTKRLGDRPAFGKDGITPHITADGFWAFGEVKTTVRAEGRDGIDGSAVRFLLVDSYEDIPQSGETCNGGFRYLVRREGWAVIGEPAATGNGEWEALELPAYLLPSEFTHLRVPGVLNANETPVYLMVRTAAGELLGVSQNAVSWAVGDVVTWEFAEAVRVPNGATVQLFLRKSPDGVSGTVPNEGVRLKSLLAYVGVCRVRYENVWYGERTPYLLAWGAGASVYYEVYAWVEYDGSAGWVRIDKTNDLATARVYGVMKYGTDMTVSGGAPVGRNAEGQACVPVAGYSMPGSVMPATADGDAEAGQTFMRDGRMWVRMANPGLPGVGKTSYTRVVENTNSIGLTEDLKFAVPRAAAFQWGVIKVGSSVPQSNGMPWIIPVGAADTGVLNEYGHDITGQLMNNVLVGGALRTATKATWLTWVPNGINVNLLPEGSNAVGLMTSRSFSQNAAEGLVLCQATNTLLGGVTVCSTIGSGSGLVPSVGAVVNYLHANYYTRSQVYSREETYSKAEVDGIDRKIRVDASATYKTVEAAKSDHDALSGMINGCMRKTASVERIEAMPQVQYNRLPQVGAKTLYLLLEE